MKSKTRKEREHMSKVADLGCIICGDIPELHHVTTQKGMGLRASHFDVIGLCQHIIELAVMGLHYTLALKLGKRISVLN